MPVVMLVASLAGMTFNLWLTRHCRAICVVFVFLLALLRHLRAPFSPHDISFHADFMPISCRQARCPQWR